MPVLALNEKQIADVLAGRKVKVEVTMAPQPVLERGFYHWGGSAWSSEVEKFMIHPSMSLYSEAPYCYFKLYKLMWEGGIELRAAEITVEKIQGVWKWVAYIKRNERAG